MPDPFNVSSGGGHGLTAPQPTRSPDGFFQNVLQKSQASTPALAPRNAGRGPRQVVGLQPSGPNPVSTALHALIHGTQTPAEHQKEVASLPPVQGAPVLNPITVGLQQLLHLPSIFHTAHAEAVKIAHPSAANPPSLHREVTALLNGAFGIPRMGVNDQQYPKDTLFHGSPEGDLGQIDALHHTKAWREGPGFYLTSNLEKAQKYAAGKTASAARKAGTGAVNAFRLKPGTKVINLDTQSPDFWHGLAEKVAGPVDPAIYRQWASDIHPDDAKGASIGILNRLRLMHFLTGYEEMPQTDAYYAIEEALHQSGVQATLHYENGVPVHVVKDASVLERVFPTAPHPLLAARPPAIPAIQKGPIPTVKTLGETVTEGLQGARGLRTGQEKLRSTERGLRAEAYAKSLQARPTLAGHQEAKQLLAGELPKLRFAGFEEFTSEAMDAMVQHVADHPTLMPFQKTRTIDALAKIHGGKVPTKGEEKLLRQVFGNDTTKDLVQSVSKFRQLKAIGYDVLNLPRSVMASFDASGIMRQGLMIGTGHPVIFAKNIPAYLKALRSEDFYNAGMAGLHGRPNATNGIYEKMGVDLTELAPRSDAAAREESFRSPIAEKIPGVRMSGRGFTLYLDSARADLADHLYAKAVANEGKLVRSVEMVNGRPKIVSRPLNPNDSHLLESIGSLVNSASGRGDLGEGVIGRSQEGLNLLLFSPRLIKSRVDFINPFWYAKLDPLARHQAYRALGGLVVLMSTALGISRAAGAQVNMDPRSSDFAKIKIGDTRLDLAGGFQQYMRILAELGSQSTVSSTTGKATPLGPEAPGKTSDWDLVFRFLRSKLAPVSSAAVDISQQRNTVGQPLTWQNTILSRLTPLSGQDAVTVGRDAAKNSGSVPAGVFAGLGAFGLSAIGGGVQNYQPKAKKVKSTGDPWGASGGGSAGGSDPWGVSP